MATPPNHGNGGSCARFPLCSRQASGVSCAEPRGLGGVVEVEVFWCREAAEGDDVRLAEVGGDAFDAGGSAGEAIRG